MSDPRAEAPEYESRHNNSCALLTAEEFARVITAAELYISSRSMLNGLIAALGDLVGRGLNRIPEEFRVEIVGKVHEALVFAQGASTTRMDDEPGKESNSGLYSGAAILSGLGGGVGGWASILAELPLTTCLMLRSIADIGRAYGERLDDPLFRQTYIEVFAYGSPIEADEEELAFLAARVGAIEATELFAKIAVRYVAALGPKFAATAVPLAGAICGAAVNFGYMSFINRSPGSCLRHCR